MDLQNKIKKMHGPILILGASGFIGANLIRCILKERMDVYGTTTNSSNWRVKELPRKNIYETDLLVDSNLENLFNKIMPKTVFNCVAYGAYSFESNSQLILNTNFNLTAKILDFVKCSKMTAYVHAGSSSEYGNNSFAPKEDDNMLPNSYYSVSKIASSNLISYCGKSLKLPCVNLRLYSVYGPFEDASRFIPALIHNGLQGKYPPLVNQDISRDFIYIDDVCEAFINFAIGMNEKYFGESFNVGTGVKTSIKDVAFLAKTIFELKEEPTFSSMPKRDWDVKEWMACTDKIFGFTNWKPKIEFKCGLLKTIEWYKSIKNENVYLNSSKQNSIDRDRSISAIIACYKDVQAIPIMYKRLKEVFLNLKIDYEIIFVNDCSPDNTEIVIKNISMEDKNIIGISHSRNFGSQAAFRSGMQIASKNACVLLDGDLQDPPELIEQFIEKWKDGYDVVYGVRIKREASLFMQTSYKFFYRLFSYFSYIEIPKDAGDFSLIDRKVVSCLLEFPERDLFLRGIRAFAGFKQTGVEYNRPERVFGKTTNSLFRNFNWAKKGIFSFSYAPLNILTFTGIALFIISMSLILIQVLVRIFFPGGTPKGITTVLLYICFFGSINLLSLSIIGEYIAKIFEEVKQRPHFIRSNIIKNGEIRTASIDLQIKRKG